MKIAFAIVVVSGLFISCKKDKYTTAPQIEFKSFTPGTTSAAGEIPVLTLRVTDAEGDLGFKNGKDTAFIYIRNLLQPTPHVFDSLPFPDIQSAGTRNFKADIDITLTRFLGHNCSPGSNVTDTIYYEVYVKDFAKNQSNVITTDALYFSCF